MANFVEEYAAAPGNPAQEQTSQMNLREHIRAAAMSLAFLSSQRRGA
jgi:hypothetical protein